METQKLILFSFYFFLLTLLTGNQYVQGGSFQHHLLLHRGPYGFQPKKLFVFGDSYSDTGNTNKSTSSSWKFPYGITNPGRPTGRFSSGHILTDYLATSLGLKSPVPYELRKHEPHRLKYGMSFSFGGSGVFETRVSYPNMSVQIDLLENLIKEGSVYSKSDLESSLALVALSGNDYSAYLANNGSALGLPLFIVKVVKQLAINLKRIHDLGMKKIAVTAIEPLGCLPRSTAAYSYERCNVIDNICALFHGILLEEEVKAVNSKTKDSIVILDLYDAFNSVLENNVDSQGSVKFKTQILKPCCLGNTDDYYCGDVDEKGEKLYTVCENPEASFFWDTVHPTQAGWSAVFSALNLTDLLQIN